MGLSYHSTGVGVLENELRIERSSPEDCIIALAGNPNVGKSTVFNNLTGLSQHTGNWPGKTVTNAQGKYKHKNRNFILVDIPGTYSLMANSAEEEVARDFVCFGNPDATVIVADATCLERNMNLVLQILEITDRVVVCVNLIDEAKKKKISINCKELSMRLGIPVIATNARSSEGLSELMDAVYETAVKRVFTNPIRIIYDDILEQAIKMIQPKIQELAGGKLNNRWLAIRLLDDDGTLLSSINKHLGFDLLNDAELPVLVEKAKKHLADNGILPELFRDKIVSNLVCMAEDICDGVVSFGDIQYNRTDRKIDRFITSKAFGIPIMLALLALILWLTIAGANYPSKLIAAFLFGIEDRLNSLFVWVGAPQWLHGLVVAGIYRTLAWVVSVMLPPMAIFFPLFTLLEDLGYLPRVAFNLDNFFKKACAHGKQSLTMCMGFGCNAAGVIGCRIIDSPQERLIATITNTFVPCNGRFPSLIAIITMFFAASAGASFQSFFSALILTGAIIMGVAMTLVISRILSMTVLKGLPSSFTLELPPYRRPQIGKVIIRSVFDRTLFVLGRSVSVAAPAGLVIWLMANMNISGTSLLTHCAGFLDPFAKLIGLDGYILMAFILGFPANEIVIPIVIMSYLAKGSILEMDNLYQLKELLISNGWNWLTAVCFTFFSLMHWPCGTTLWTIKKETQSWKWTLVSFFVPTIAGVLICFAVASTAHIIGLS